MADPQPKTRDEASEMSLAPLPPGETLDGPKYQAREPEEGIDVVAVPLAPPGKSREEAQLEVDPELAEQVRKLRNKALSGPPAPPAPEPWIQFNIRDLLVVSGALAVGLAAGRIETSGYLIFFLGWAAVISSAYVLLSETKSQFWKVVMFCLLAAYLGGILSAALRVFQRGDVVAQLWTSGW